MCLLLFYLSGQLGIYTAAFVIVSVAAIAAAVVMAAPGRRMIPFARQMGQKRNKGQNDHRRSGTTPVFRLLHFGTMPRKKNRML